MPVAQRKQSRHFQQHDDDDDAKGDGQAEHFGPVDLVAVARNVKVDLAAA